MNIVLNAIYTEGRLCPTHRSTQLCASTMATNNWTSARQNGTMVGQNDKIIQGSLNPPRQAPAPVIRELCFWFKNN